MILKQPGSLVTTCDLPSFLTQSALGRDLCRSIHDAFSGNQFEVYCRASVKILDQHDVAFD